jgi:imidazolonepropionase-like amidohydrolase
MNVLIGIAALETLAVVGGAVETMDGERIASAAVIVKDGRIEKVVPGGAAPAGATVIDAAGRIVTPGILAADTGVGLVEISLEPTANDESVDASPPDPNRAAFRAIDALNPRSVLVPVQRVEGVTTAIAAPDGGLVSGQSVLFDLFDGSRADVVGRAPLAIHVNLGAGGGMAVGGSRGWAITHLREILDDARTYARTRAQYEKNQSRVLQGSRLDLEALGLVLQGRIPLALRVDREADILAALDLAREQRIRIVILGGAEAWRVAAALARDKVPVLVRATENGPGSFDSLSSRLDNAALLHRAGVNVGLTASGFPHNVRTLRQEAGIAVAYGLPYAAGLRAITRVVAEAFGVDKDYGRIAPGQVANLVVWSGDPLELSTQVAHVIVRGRDLPLRSRQTELRERYRSVDGMLPRP